MGLSGNSEGSVVAGPWAQLGRRAVFTAGAYLLAAAVVVATFIALKGRVDPRLLQGLLGYFFIASMSAGLEPGTIKAAALAGASGSAARDVDVRAALAASALKGIAASPIVALVWRFADPHIDVAALMSTPGLCVAGFAATDLRVWLDLDGRHAAAIWLKQGGLAGGLAIVAVLVWLGWPLAVAIGVSTVARLALAATAGVWIAAGRGADKGKSRASMTSRIIGLFADHRWLEFAGVSLVAAISGGADRVFGLRYLTPEAWAGYYLIYEVFSKFWFIPYLLGPILFARRVAEGPRSPFIREAWRLTAGAGLMFLIGVIGLVGLAPHLPISSLHLPLGLPTGAFAAAVVINSFVQLRIVELQGAGASRRVLAATGLCAAASGALFFIGARTLGAPGLMGAWLIKSVMELSATSLAKRFPPPVV